MKSPENIEYDSILDNYITDSVDDYTKLELALARFADLAAASQFQIILNYSAKIQNACLKWENQYKEVYGIKQLCIAVTNYYHTKFNEVIEPCKEALQILKHTKYSNLFGLANMILGANHRSLGDLDVAVKHLIIGGETIEVNSKLAIYKCYCYYQLGEIYRYINDYEASQIAFKTAIEIAENLNNITGLFRAYNGIANLFLAKKDYINCKKHLLATLALDNLSESQKSRSYCDLGIYHYELEEYIEAEKVLTQSYNLRIKFNLFDAASTSLIYLAKTQIALLKNNEASQKIKEGIEIANQFKSKSKLLEFYKIKAELATKNQNWKEAAESFLKYNELNNELSAKQIQNIYRLKNNKIQIQKELIEELYVDVQDSIKYAKRIQSAIMPSNQTIDSLLPNSFIYYEPKDIVAGDFYWLEKIDETILFAVADCTGHGVPGALVSIVCNNALNRAVREFKLRQPNLILDKVKTLITSEFELSDEAIYDGMDIALCALQGRKLEFAGAHNPLWIIRENELIEYKADKQPIGLFEYSVPYSNHTILLEKNDTLYIFSDGYIDQFGGERNKKYKSKSFKSFLLSIQDIPIHNQVMKLKEEFINWKGDYEQIDDVCVMGIKIK